MPLSRDNYYSEVNNMEELSEVMENAVGEEESSQMLWFMLHPYHLQAELHDHTSYVMSWPQQHMWSMVPGWQVISQILRTG